MEILKKILMFMLYPVEWFWMWFEKCKDSIWKLIILFTISLSGLAVIGMAFAYLIMWLCTYHPDKIVLAGLVCWLYAYVKKERDNKKLNEAKVQQKEQENLISQKQKLVEEMAWKAYPIVHEVLYHSLKECAKHMKCITPTTPQEIEMVEESYILGYNNICFYQFRVFKEDIRLMFTEEELEDCKKIIQSVISRKIQNKEFVKIQTEKIIDKYGNVFDVILVDNVKDMGNYLKIQVTLGTLAYAEYWRNKQLTNSSNTSTLPVTDRDF